MSDPAAEWQATFDAIRDPVAVVDRAGRVVRCNRAMAALLGRPRKRVCGRLLDDLSTLPLDCEELMGRHTGAATELEIAGRWWRAQVDPMPGTAGAVLTLVDLTERRRLEQELSERARELAEADRKKDDYLAMLAHELRNPLGAINTASFLLDEVSPQSPESTRLRRTVSRQVKHLVRLVDDLLDVSRLQHGRVLLKRQKVDLRVSVEDAGRAVAREVRARHHQLHVDVPEQPVWVLADPTRLEQIVANLLDNAVKYTEGGGQVWVTLGLTTTGCACLRVRDSGLGISEDLLPHVFDLFTQGNASLDRGRGGLGIGLTVVRRLVELHGGSVTVDSPGPGHGTEFVVTLPLLLPEQLIGSGTSSVPPLAPGGRLASRRILVIDDNEDARDTLRALLELWGHTVEVAADGPEGLEKALGAPPDIALVDIGLPGLDGYQVAERLRSEETAGRMLLVALTGYGSARDRARALSAGFDAHLVKPVDPATLSRILAR